MTKESAPIIRITRKGMMIWIGLVLFISLWMFVLGILVGRGTAPVNLEADKLEKELEALKAKVLKQEEEKVVAQAEGKDGQAPELKFYEALKNPEKAPQFKPVRPVDPPAPKLAPKPAPEPAAPAAKPAPAAPAPKPAPAPAPKKVADKGKFSLSLRWANKQMRLLNTHGRGRRGPCPNHLCTGRDGRQDSRKGPSPHPNSPRWAAAKGEAFLGPAKKSKNLAHIIRPCHPFSRKVF